MLVLQHTPISLVLSFKFYEMKSTKSQKSILPGELEIIALYPMNGDKLQNPTCKMEIANARSGNNSSIRYLSLII